MSKKILIGKFKQIITMDKLPSTGHIADSELEIIENGGVLITEQGKIEKILDNSQFISLSTDLSDNINFVEIKQPLVLIPGLIDSHTHICFAGSRAHEYAMKLEGYDYLEIAREGGGIMSTVNSTRTASFEELSTLTYNRSRIALSNGITTCEVKSGYGLTVEDELKILKVIKNVGSFKDVPDLIPTCLAAHVKPPEFSTHKSYLDHILEHLLPLVKENNLSNRVDIFIEEDAFNPSLAKQFLNQAKNMGFDIVVHADQFSVGGTQVAAEVGAISADHLEASSIKELNLIKEKNVFATVLPGASLGLGIPYAPAKKILDEDLALVIASDWNPGTAPMGDLLTEAALLGAYEKLSISETLASITIRAAQALNLFDRGSLIKNNRADMCAFPCEDYTEIFYHQGALKPKYVWKNGNLILS